MPRPPGPLPEIGRLSVFVATTLRRWFRLSQGMSSPAESVGSLQTRTRSVPEPSSIDDLATLSRRIHVPAGIVAPCRIVDRQSLGDRGRALAQTLRSYVEPAERQQTDFSRPRP